MCDKLASSGNNKKFIKEFKKVTKVERSKMSSNLDTDILAMFETFFGIDAMLCAVKHVMNRLQITMTSHLGC